MLLLSHQFYKKNSHIFDFSLLKCSSYCIWITALLIAIIGVMTLYSVSGGHWKPWAYKQIIHFSIGAVVMIFVASINVRILYYSSYIVYIASIVLLIMVRIIGCKALGATRWINLGFFAIQPSEITKIALVMVLACYFDKVQFFTVRSAKGMILPLIILSVPFAMICTQPDLATSVILLVIFTGMIFIAGVRIWKFIAAGLMFIALVPIIWRYLRGYQKLRIVNFFNPDYDPLGSGYNVIQSKIAIGSGGFFGKGFINGAQSQLNFLPESHTDFAFTAIAEEFGFFGCIIVMLLYAIIIFRGLSVASEARSYFCKMLSVGSSLFFFTHVFFNASMITGVVPVMGIPMPMISYGGTIVITSAIFLGFIISCEINKNAHRV